MRAIHIIGVPLDLGGNRRGTDMGPSAFRIAGIGEQIAALGLAVTDKGDIPSPIPELKGPGDSKKRYVKEIAKVCQRLYQASLASLDDGALLHTITSPKAALPKVYRAALASDLRDDEAGIFASGTLVLESETDPLAPAGLVAIAPRLAGITMVEGRYHQVRRMFAAVGNHVETLHRVSIGGLDLGDLEPGQWRLLDAADLDVLFRRAGA